MSEENRITDQVAAALSDIPGAAPGALVIMTGDACEICFETAAQKLTEDDRARLLIVSPRKKITREEFPYFNNFSGDRIIFTQKTELLQLLGEATNDIKGPYWATITDNLITELTSLNP